MARNHKHQSALRWEDIGRVDLPVGIYTRRSRDDQSSYSPAAQERIGRGYCDTNRLQVVDVYLDDDYSGTSGERPAFARMQRDAAAGRIKVIVVPKMDRFARDVILCLQTYDALRALGVRVVSVAEPLDFDTPMGRKFLTDAASTAEWYSRNLATEVQKGQREKVQQGGWIGLLPLGYVSRFELDARGERIKGTGRAVFSDDIGTVRHIFSLYASGNHSDLTIAEELNAAGLTANHKGRRVPFQRDTVKSILTNPFYIGIIRFKGAEYEGAHEPAIDRDLWARCQAVRERRSQQNGGRLPIRGLGGMLSELIFCGRCGAKMHTMMCGEGASRQRYYRCARRRRFGKSACDAPFVPAAQVEAQILGILRALTLPPEVRNAVIAVVQQRLAHPATPEGAHVAMLEARMERLKDLYELGDLPRDEYLKKRKRLQDQIRRNAPQHTRALDTDRALTLLGDMAALLDAATPDQQRALLQQVIAMIWAEKGAVTAIRPAPNFALLMQTVRMWQKRSRLGSNQQPSAPEADALSD